MSQYEHAQRITASNLRWHRRLALGSTKGSERYDNCRLYFDRLYVASAIRSCEAEPMRPSLRRWIKCLAWLILSIFTLAFLMTAYLVATIATKGLCVTAERGRRFRRCRDWSS